MKQLVAYPYTHTLTFTAATAQELRLAVLSCETISQTWGLASFVFRKVKEGTPLNFALVMAFLYTNTQNGMAAVVNNEVERLTGRKPITLRQYMEDYRQSWNG